MFQSLLSLSNKVWKLIIFFFFFVFLLFPPSVTREVVRSGFQKPYVLWSWVLVWW